MTKKFLDKMYSIVNAKTTSDEIKTIYDEWANQYDHDLVDDHAYVMPDRAAQGFPALPSIRQVSLSLMDVTSARICWRPPMIIRFITACSKLIFSTRRWMFSKIITA